MNSPDLGTRSIPCRINPDRWWSKDPYVLGQAKHICISHCRIYAQCDKSDVPLLSGLRAGTLYNSSGKVAGIQPREVYCNSCVDPDAEKCTICRNELPPSTFTRPRKYCSPECRSIGSGRAQSKRQSEARKKCNVLAWGVGFGERSTEGTADCGLLLRSRGSLIKSTSVVPSPCACSSIG